MSILKSILKTLGKTKRVTASLSEPPVQEEYFVTKDKELRTHLDLVKEHFSFLTSELGFTLTRSRMDGHEHTTQFTRDNIDVHLVFAHGTLPLIYVINSSLPYDESMGLDNREIVEEYSREMKTIMDMHSERLKPVYEKFYQNNYDQKYFQEDFEKYGMNDYIKYMTLAGIATKNIIINQKGKIKFTL